MFKWKNILNEEIQKYNICQKNTYKTVHVLGRVRLVCTEHRFSCKGKCLVTHRDRALSLSLVDSRIN